jgi:hypothetical protein
VYSRGTLGLVERYSRGTRRVLVGCSVREPLRRDPNRRRGLRPRGRGAHGHLRSRAGTQGYSTGTQRVQWRAGASPRSGRSAPGSPLPTPAPETCAPTPATSAPGVVGSALGPQLLFLAQVCIMIHSGSRGLGHQVCAWVCLCVCLWVCMRAGLCVCVNVCVVCVRACACVRAVVCVCAHAHTLSHTQTRAHTRARARGTSRRHAGRYGRAGRDGEGDGARQDHDERQAARVRARGLAGEYSF